MNQEAGLITRPRQLLTVDLLSDEEVRNAAKDLHGLNSRGGSGDVHATAEDAYAEGVRRALQQAGAAPFLVEFISRKWAQLLIELRECDTNDQRVDRMLQAGVMLVMSTQPKSSAAQRDALVRSMPTLIQTLEEGMQLLGMDSAERGAFFSELMPAQAEALRGNSVAHIAINSLGSSTLQQALERILDPALNLLEA